jgi:hypothetical protein
MPTGEEVDRYITVATDRDDMTPGQIEQIAQETIEDSQENYPYQVTGVTLQSGTRRGDDILQGGL